MGRLTSSNSNTCLLNDESRHVMFCSFSRIRYSNMSHFFYKKEPYRVEERTRFIRARENKSRVYFCADKRRRLSGLFILLELR